MAKTPYGGKLHRRAKVKGGRSVILAADHPAVINGHSLFRDITHPSNSPRLLISGRNSRKIGGKVQLGRWAGFQIYTLTLEERATCPTTCEQWRGCYGNNMHWPRRHEHGHALEEKLAEELAQLAARHPRGFVVRLHVLGDFYSEEYAKKWLRWLEEFPQLHIFGYTAHHPHGDIGYIINWMNRDDRCWIRFSGCDLGPAGSVVIAHKIVSEHVICPAQTDKTDCCATCGLCWTMHRTVEFLQH